MWHMLMLWFNRHADFSDSNSISLSDTIVSVCVCVCVCVFVCAQCTASWFEGMRHKRVCHTFSGVLAFFFLPSGVNQGQVLSDGQGGVNSRGRNKVDLTSVKDLVLGIKSDHLFPFVSRKRNFAALTLSLIPVWWCSGNSCLKWTPTAFNFGLGTTLLFTAHSPMSIIYLWLMLTDHSSSLVRPNHILCRRVGKSFGFIVRPGLIQR